MHKFKCPTLEQLSPGTPVDLEHAEKNHLFKILRAAPGEHVLLLDGKGRLGQASVADGRLLILDSVQKRNPPALRIHLYIAPPRKQKMDPLLKQLGELGVARIVPLLCERSVALPGTDSVNERWNDLLFEACKQSGNLFLPELQSALKMKEAVADAKERCDAVFYGSPRKSGTALPEENLKNQNGGTLEIAFFVGPEGGFAPEEEEWMNRADFLPLKVGRWTLRVETAALAGIAVLLDRFSAFADEEEPEENV